MTATLDAFLDDSPIYVPSLEEKIRRRRLQIIVHSYLYYELDSPLISDEKWQIWADELTALQEDLKEIGFYDEVFADWNGSTGMHLPKDDPWVERRAKWLLKQNYKFDDF